MAAPSYTEDLTDIDLAESTTGWSAYGGGGAGLSASPDLAMQGTNCVDKQITAADKGQYFDNGAGITLGAGDHVFIWHFTATPGLTDTIQNKGASVLIGTGGTAYCQFHVDGNDTFGAGGRVAKCHAVDYSVRSASAVPPYRTVTGSPGANPQVFGGGLVTTASVKGANVGIDAIRYGTGAYLTAGELISAGDGSDNPCTFTGFAAQDASISNRWGILFPVGGGFELQGIFAIGQNNAGTATLARFEESNVIVNFADTIHSAVDFTQILIDHASTVCNWTNVVFNALGSHNPGQVRVLNDSTDCNWQSCQFNGIGITELRAGVSALDCIWRGCDQIICLGAADLTGSSVSDYVSEADSAADDKSALVWDINTNPNGLLDDMTFSKATGLDQHAIEFGQNSPTTLDLTGITFSGYNAANGQLDSALHIRRTTGTVTVNITGGTTPSYKSDGATVDIVATSTVTLTDLVPGTEVRVYRADSNEAEIAGTESSGTSFAFADSPGEFVFIRILNKFYEPADLENFEIPATSTSVPISQRFDRNYSNP